jgi:hypothetical protein|tara:strand:- start:141 stop:767 length:627 start_codon:yes stop_codon:yes gene_type:complete
MSTSPTTQLQAVNILLSTIGEAPVSSLSSGLLDAETAETLINEVSRNVQSMGWNFNTELNLTISPNEAGEVVLPVEYVRADLAQSLTKFRSSTEEYILRGQRMYDKVKHSFIISKPLKLDVVTLLNFAYLPEVARRYITAKASRIFQERVVGSDTLSAMNRQDETEALYALREMEGDNGDYNIFDDYGTASVLDRTISTQVINNGSSF